MKRLSIAFIALVIVSPATASTVRMIYKNTTHEYFVRFDDVRRTFRLDDDTYYGVLSIERQPEQIIVAGTTVGDGPTFRAVLSRSPHIDFFTASKLFQTDRCHY